MSFSDQLLRTGAGKHEFCSTHWSVVLQAGQEHSPQSAAALEKLCHGYWYPLYSFARRQGYNPHEAADLTQDFFTHLLSTNALAAVAVEKGKFRSFLLASLKNLMANQWNRARCQKRGGGAPVFSLDEQLAEGRYQHDAGSELTAEKIFNRRWAETLLARALERLKAECDSNEKTRRFEEAKRFLLSEQGPDTMETAAFRLNMTLSGMKGLVFRLRRRFGQLIREDIAQTVATPEEIEEEIRSLFAAFGD